MSLTSDFSVTAIKKFSLIASGVAVAALLARYLGPELRAEYAVIVNAAAIGVVLLNFGVSNAYQSARRKHGFRVVQAFAIYSLILFGALATLAMLGLGVLDDTPATLLVVTSFSLFRMQLQSYGLVESIRGAAYASILGSIAELVLVSTLWLLASPSLFWALGALLAKDAVIAGLSLVIVATSYRSQRRDEGDPGRLFEGGWSKIVGKSKFSLFQSFPFFVLTVLIVVNYRVDVLVLDLLDVDKSQIGIFVVGVLVSEYLWIFSDIFKDIQISRTARGSTASDVARANRAAIAVTMFVYVPFLTFGQWAIVLFFGVDFAQSFEVAALMLIANIFMIPCKIIGAFYISLHRVNVYLAGMGAAVVLNVALNLLLIPSLGVRGAIAASILSYFVGGAVVTADFVRHAGVPLSEVVLLRRRDVEAIRRKLHPRAKGRTGTS